MSDARIKELEDQVAELLKHKGAVNKVMKGIQEKIQALDKRVTSLEQRVTALEQKKSLPGAGPGVIVPV